MDKFFLRGSFSLIENHDLPIGASGDDVFEQVKTESTQAIPVGNHNFSDNSFDRGVQKGLKSFSFEVETWSNIFDNSMVWISRSKEVNLSLEIGGLSSGGNATVTEIGFIGEILGGKKIFSGVSVLAGRSPDGLDFTGMSPGKESFCWDTKELSDFSGAEMFVEIIHEEKEKSCFSSYKKIFLLFFIFDYLKI